MLTKATIKRSSTQVLSAIAGALFAFAVFAQQTSAETTSQRVMKFPTETAARASILYVAGNTADPYVESRWSTYITVTSYNSVPEQTDSTPFITASGTHVRDGVVASNYLPIGTRVRFPNLYGSKIFVVEDRMNARYHKKIDIWSDDIQFSRKFGARYLKMEVL